MEGPGGANYRACRAYRGIAWTNQSRREQKETDGERKESSLIASSFSLALGLNHCKATTIRSEKHGGPFLLHNQLIPCISAIIEIMSQANNGGVGGKSASELDKATNAVQQLSFEGNIRPESPNNSEAGGKKTGTVPKAPKPAGSTWKAKERQVYGKVNTRQGTAAARKATSSATKREDEGTTATEEAVADAADSAPRKPSVAPERKNEKELNDGEEKKRAEAVAALEEQLDNDNASGPPTEDVAEVEKAPKQEEKEPLDEQEPIGETVNLDQTDAAEPPSSVAPRVPLTPSQRRRVQRRRQKAKAAGNTPPVEQPGPSSKRSRGEDGAAAAPKRKRTKFSDIVARNLKMAIVNKADRLEWRLSEATADEIHAKLKRLIAENAITGATPRFTASGLIQGHFLVNCFDLPARHWLEEAVRRIKPEDGHVVLGCVQEDEIPQRAIIRITTDCGDETEVRNCLDIQNQALQVRSWKLIGRFACVLQAGHGRPVLPGFGYKYAVGLAAAEQIKKDGGVWLYMRHISVKVSIKGEKEADAEDENSASEPTPQ